MDRGKKILGAIKQDGEDSAKLVLDKAKVAAKEGESQARSRANAIIKEKVGEKELKCGEVFSNAKELSVMRQSLQVLSAKNKVIDRLFDKVLNNLRSMPKVKYEKFILALLEKYAEDNDVVNVAREDKIIDIVKKSKVYSDRHLSIKVSDELTDGVILESEYFVKSLTLENIVAEKRMELLTSLSQKLF